MKKDDKKSPFFAQFLENQSSIRGGSTHKHPSDTDESTFTIKYPSDKDEALLSE
ncbi:MAG: microviridin/marinostatin family tricyclic proteinase inhibitor [Bacteroidota bacterium]